MKKIILSFIFCAVSFVVAFSQINITASTTAPEVQFVLSVDGVLQDGRNGTINTIYPGPQQWTTNKSLSFADEAAVMAWAQGYGITFDVEREICFRIRTRVRGCGSYCLSNWSPNARCFDFAAVLFTCDDCVEIALADVLTVGDSVFFNVCAVDETGVCVEVLNTYGIELPIHGVDTILLDAGIYAHVNVDGNAQLFGYTFLSPSSSVVTTVVPGPTPGTFQVQQDVDFSSIDVIVDCMDGVTSVGLAGIDTVQLPTPTLSHLDGELLLGQCEEVLSSVPAEVGNIDDDFNFVVIGGDSICVPSCCYIQPYILPQFGVCPVIFPGDTNPKDSIIASGGDGYELVNEAGVVIETVPTDGVIADYTFLLPRGIPEGVYTLTITGTPPVGCVTEIDFILFNDCPLLLGGDLAGTGYTNVNGSYIADVNLPAGAEINNTVNTAQIIVDTDTAYIAVQDVDENCASVTVNDSTLLLAKCKNCCPPVDMTVPLATGEEVTDPADILQVQAYVAAYRALNPECQLSGLLFEFDQSLQSCNYFDEGDNYDVSRDIYSIFVDGNEYVLSPAIPLSAPDVETQLAAQLGANGIVFTGVFWNPVFPQRIEILGLLANTAGVRLQGGGGSFVFPFPFPLTGENCVLQPGGGTYIYEDVCGTVILTKEPAPEQVNEITIDTTGAKCITITDELDGKSAELQRCCPPTACDTVFMPAGSTVAEIGDSIAIAGCGAGTVVAVPEVVSSFDYETTIQAGTLNRITTESGFCLMTGNTGEQNVVSEITRCLADLGVSFGDISYTAGFGTATIYISNVSDPIVSMGVQIGFPVQVFNFSEVENSIIEGYSSYIIGVRCEIIPKPNIVLTKGSECTKINFLGVGDVSLQNCCTGDACVIDVTNLVYPFDSDAVTKIDSIRIAEGCGENSLFIHIETDGTAFIPALSGRDFVTTQDASGWSVGQIVQFYDANNNLLSTSTIISVNTELDPVRITFDDPAPPGTVSVINATFVEFTQWVVNDRCGITLIAKPAPQQPEICDDNSTPVSRVNVKNEGTLYVETTYKNPVDSIVYVPNQIGVFCASATATNDAIAAAFANSPTGQTIAGCPGAMVTWIPGTGLIFGGTNDFTDYSGVFLVYSTNDCEPAQVVAGKAQFWAEESPCIPEEPVAFISQYRQNVSNTDMKIIFENSTAPTNITYISEQINQLCGSEAATNTGIDNAFAAPGTTTTVCAGVDITYLTATAPLYTLFVEFASVPDMYGWSGVLRYEYVNSCGNTVTADIPVTANENIPETCLGPNNEKGRVFTDASGARWCLSVHTDGDIITTLIP